MSSFKPLYKNSWALSKGVPLKILFSLLILMIGLINGEEAWALTDKAQNIFEHNHHAVYQIQVIDINSHEKSVIGSGFQISEDGLFATNYHVIRDVVDKPNFYRIEYHREGRREGSLVVQVIDVAHDLAILKATKPGENPLSLGSSKMDQGAHVYAMGNPLDVGMVIIQGTYNGLVGDAPYQQILLSASLNSGMSGGPAFDPMGNVVGVNVSIRGNALSYLVPVEHLIKLEKEFREAGRQENWTETIQNQILQRFDHMISKTLETEWSYENYGSLKVPQNILSPIIKCWGKSRQEDPQKSHFYFYGYKWCESDKRIYLSSKLSTGGISYAFFWLESESLSPLEFYKQFTKAYSQSGFYPPANENEVTGFNCQNHFVNIANRHWKSAYCVRRYKKYPKLHDVFLSFAILGDSPRKHVIQIGLSGSNETLARRFFRKFLGGLQWND